MHAALGAPSALRYTVLDLEFTGLSPREGDRVIEIAGLRIENGEVVAEYRRSAKSSNRAPPIAPRCPGAGSGRSQSAG